MTEIDHFAALLLNEAKRFLEKAAECDEDTEEQADLHAALLLGFCSLDANINAIALDFDRKKDLSAHDRSILFEREVQLDNGEFVDIDRLKMWRMEDRIQFLHKRLSGKSIDRTAPWWAELRAGNDLRNELTHPKTVPVITVEKVRRALQAIIEAINAVYLAIYKVKFPAANRGLISPLNF